MGTFNQALFDECSNCVLPYTVAYSGCTNLVTGVCGSLSPVSGNDLKSSEKFVYVPNFFSDDLCGQVCFAGEASAASGLQTYMVHKRGLRIACQKATLTSGAALKTPMLFYKHAWQKKKLHKNCPC